MTMFNTDAWADIEKMLQVGNEDGNIDQAFATMHIIALMAIVEAIDRQTTAMKDEWDNKPLPGARW
jgi:hypothetical protein